MSTDGPDWTNLASIIRENGTVLTVGSKPVYLGRYTVTSSRTTGSLSVVPSDKITTAMSGLAVLVTTNTTADLPVCVLSTPVVTNAPLYLQATAPFCPAGAGTNPPYLAYLPANVSAGEQVEVMTYYASGGNKHIVYVWGLTGPPPVQMRSDGRVYPPGWRSAWSRTTTSGAYTIVASPPSPQRIMVRSAALLGGKTAHGFLIMEVKTSAVDLALYPGLQSVVWTPPGGKLLDPSTSVYLSQSSTGTAGQISVSLDYDLYV